MDLENLKEEYNKLSKKHALPEFNELNRNFEIDRIERDTDFLLREVRKTMMDKIVSYIRFLEMIIYPATAPPMFMLFLKALTEEERKLVEKAYMNFIELELNSLKLEIDYSEESEAESIKKITTIWEKNKINLKNIITIMEKNWNVNSAKREKLYFG